MAYGTYSKKISDLQLGREHRDVLGGIHHQGWQSWRWRGGDGPCSRGLGTQCYGLIYCLTNWLCRKRLPRKTKLHILHLPLWSAWHGIPKPQIIPLFIKLGEVNWLQKWSPILKTLWYCKILSLCSLSYFLLFRIICTDDFIKLGYLVDGLNNEIICLGLISKDWRIKLL